MKNIKVNWILMFLFLFTFSICSINTTKALADTLADSITKEFEFNKIPREFYLGNTYKILPYDTIKKLKPTKIVWTSSSKNLQVTNLEATGTSGCQLTISKIASSNNKGEKVKLTAEITYLLKDKTKTKSYTKTLTMLNSVKQIKIKQSDLIFKTSKQKETLTVEFNNNNTSDIPTNQKIKWLVTDKDGKVDKNGKKVASVSSKGIISPKGPGITYITACAQDSYDKSTKTYKLFSTIQVTCPIVNSVSFKSDTPNNLSLNSKLELKDKLIWNPQEPYNLEKMKLKWSSSDKTIATVSSRGQVKTKKKAGSVTITVEATGGVPKGAAIPKQSITLTIK